MKSCLETDSAQHATAVSAATGDSHGHHFNQSVGKISRSELIDGSTARKLSQRRPFALASRLLLDYAIMAAAVVMCELYWHPVVYVLAIMTIGARQAGIGSVALHDGVHRLLARNKRVNDLIGRCLGLSVGVPIVEDYDLYRQRHFAHHRCTNTEEDPDAWIHQKFYDVSRLKGALFLLQALFGVVFFSLFVSFLIRQWKSDKVVFLGVVACIAALITGVALRFYPAVLLLQYAVVPLATWGLFVNLIRGLAEHYPENEFQRGEGFPEVFRSRDILNTWFDQLFVATRGVNFHLSHHLIPNVPFYRLPELQRELAKSKPYQKYAHITHGYHSFLLEYFFQRATPAGLKQQPRATVDRHHPTPAFTPANSK